MPESNKKSKKKRKLGINTSNPTVIYLFSVLKGLVVLMVGLSVVSVIVMKSTDFNLFTKLIVYGFILFGGFLSGFFANRKLKGRGIVNGILASLIYAVVFLIICVIAMGFNISPEILIVLPVSIVGGIIGGIISANS